MAKKLLFACLITLLFFCSCKSKPSNADIEKKVLLEYTCAETAKVNSLQIIKSSPTTSLLGFNLAQHYRQDIKKSLRTKLFFLSKVKRGGNKILRFTDMHLLYIVWYFSRLIQQ